MKNAILKKVLELFLLGFLLILKLTEFFISKHKNPNSSRIKRGTFLLTGTFFAENWAKAHIVPLANSKVCKKLYVVTTFRLESYNNIVCIYPKKTLEFIFGKVAARLMTFIFYALILRPDYIGGFHLLFNGMIACLLSNLLCSNSIYFCVSGPSETLYGGKGNNRIFKRLEGSVDTITSFLIRIVQHLDLIITMGHQAKNYFVDKNITTNIEVLPGGIDSQVFIPKNKEKEFDFITVARLSKVKRTDLLIEALSIIKNELNDAKAVIVGDGPLRSNLMKMAEDLGVKENIDFLGHRTDIENLLPKARVFVLCSDSEGLPLALVEALMCGIPVVATDVGEIKEMIENGKNGFLVEKRNIKQLTFQLLNIIQNKTTIEKMSKAARIYGLKNDIKNASKKWDEILA